MYIRDVELQYRVICKGHCIIIKKLCLLFCTNQDRLQQFNTKHLAANINLCMHSDLWKDWKAISSLWLFHIALHGHVQYFLLVITFMQPAFNECFEAVLYCVYERLQYLSFYFSLFVWFQLRYQKCLDARPPSSISCLPGPPADSVARRVGSSVKKGVQSLLGTFKRSGAQTPWENESSPQWQSFFTSLLTTVCPPPVSCKSQSSVEHAFHFSWPRLLSSGSPAFCVVSTIKSWFRNKWNVIQNVIVTQ